MATPWAPFEAPPPPPPRTPPRWRPGPAIISLAITIAVLLIADAAALVAQAIPEDDPPGKTDTRAVLVTPDQVPSPTASPLEQELPGLMRFVQDRRGLRFERPVKVMMLGEQAFKARLRGAQTSEEEEADRKELENDERVLKAYGLLEPDVDLAKVVASFRADAVAGYYDPNTDDLVVRGDRLSPFLRKVLVHELTHALQDQRYTIDISKRPADDESRTAYRALVEGDASRIEEEYFDSLPQAEQKESQREESAAAGRRPVDIPPAVLFLFLFPYRTGLPFVRAVVADGGQARLDEAFAHPPTTSEQLLHPDVFLAGQTSVPVGAPKADGKEIDAGVLGEAALSLALELVAGRGQGAAAQGWGGDRYVAWTKGEQTCARTTVAMDTARDVVELRAALRRFAENRKGTTITGPAAGPVTFTTCD